MSAIQNVTTPNMRIDYGTSNAYIGPEVPKKSFMQKLGLGMAKFMGFAGPIGAAISAIALPGIGLPIAAGLFGLTKFSQDKLYQSQVKDNMEMSSQPRITSVNYPGFFGTTPQSAGEQVTDFMAPSSLQPQLGDVIIQRDASILDSVHNY